jgi:hypothetical protein
VGPAGCYEYHALFSRQQALASLFISDESEESYTLTLVAYISEINEHCHLVALKRIMTKDNTVLYVEQQNEEEGEEVYLGYAQICISILYE